MCLHGLACRLTSLEGCITVMHATKHHGYAAPTRQPANSRSSHRSARPDCPAYLGTNSQSSSDLSSSGRASVRQNGTKATRAGGESGAGAGLRAAIRLRAVPSCLGRSVRPAICRPMIISWYCDTSGIPWSCETRPLRQPISAARKERVKSANLWPQSCERPPSMPSCRIHGAEKKWEGWREGGFTNL